MIKSSSIKNVTMSLTIRLFEVDMGGGEISYFASDPNIACGSGPTHGEARRGLAHCLAFGDQDVPNEDRVMPWIALIDESIYRMKDDGIFLDGCGIYVVTDGQLVLKKEAALRDPFPMPETFIASLLRRSCGVPEPEPPQPAQAALIPANGGLFDTLDRQEEEARI